MGNKQASHRTRRQKRVWQDMGLTMTPEEKLRFAKESVEAVKQGVREKYSGLSLEEIAAAEGITIREVGPRNSYSAMYCRRYRGQYNTILLTEEVHWGEDREHALAHELGHHFVDYIRKGRRPQTDGQGHYRQFPMFRHSEIEAAAEDFGKFLISLQHEGKGGDR